MKVWYCGHRQAAFKDAAGQCPRFENPRADAAYGCREMQLVPADALVIVKENGEWSDSTVLAFDTAAHALAETHHGREDLRLAFDVFIAALASDSADV